MMGGLQSSLAMLLSLHAVGSVPLDKVVVPSSSGAMCNDGSPYAYYVKVRAALAKLAKLATARSHAQHPRWGSSALVCARGRSTRPPRTG